MRLKLLVVAVPVFFSLGGCVVHFPLEDNVPSLASQEDSPADTGGMSHASTTPDPHDLSRGNSESTPDLPQQ